MPFWIITIAFSIFGKHGFQVHRFLGEISYIPAQIPFGLEGPNKGYLVSTMS